MNTESLEVLRLMQESTELLKQNEINEIIKLDKAYLNYREIIDKHLPYKFSYLDEWLLKESKLLHKEAVELENNELSSEKNLDGKYRVYARGTIIKADFGVNIGAEMSQVHFAIVLNKFDNKKNNVLTVVPLTSKSNKFNLDLGPLVIKKLVNKIEREMLLMGLSEETFDESNITPTNGVKVKKLLSLLSYYKSNEKNTYACCSLITTISKERILKPINEYDIIGRARCDKDILNKIDDEVIKRFTNLNLTNENI